MIPNPVQLSEIAAYVQLYGPPTVHMEIFIHLIILVDDDDLSNIKSSRGNSSS
jgi:hypothetical protein